MSAANGALGVTTHVRTPHHATSPAMPLSEGVARLARIAHRRLDVGHGPHTVLAWLGSPGTARLFGSEAAAVVARVIGGTR